MRPSAEEAAPARGRRPAGLDGPGAAEPTGAGGGVLVEQMRVLCAAALAEVLDLHDFGQHRDVHSGLRRLRVVVLPEHLVVLSCAPARSDMHS